MTVSAPAWQPLQPLVPRDPTERNRVASPLELLTDLCVVVAVGQAALALEHGLVSDHPGEYVVGYAMAFFAITWAWLTFTWFGSAYDNDDAVYRLLNILQIVGVLVLAASVEEMFDGRFAGVVIGYIIMRVGLIAQWLRAAYHDPVHRTTCLRYAGGTAIVQLGWVGFASLAHQESLRVPLFVVMVIAELAVPMVAERAGITTWHPHHIAERYGLLFLIVLGETILASTVAMKTAFEPDTKGHGSVVVLIVSSVLIVFSLWWTYFGHEASDVLAEVQGKSNRQADIWGFGHCLIFASAAAVGAGIAVRVEFWTHPGAVSDRLSAAAITVPVVIVLLAIWVVQLRQHDASLVRAYPMFVAAAVIGVATFLPYAELITGVTLAIMVVVQVSRGLHSRGGQAVTAQPPAVSS